MVPKKLDLPTIWRGCEWQAVVMYWKNADGTPFNLSLWTPFAQTNDGTSLNPLIVDAANGITSLSLTRDKTDGLTIGDFQWDWVWWNNPPTGFKYPPILAGTVPVREPETS